MEDWQQQRYEEVFDQICDQITDRRRSDPAFTIQVAREILETAYEDEGSDWTGRGPAEDTVKAATIAAYEHMVAEWEAESAETRPPSEPGTRVSTPPPTPPERRGDLGSHPPGAEHR